MLRDGTGQRQPRLIISWEEAAVKLLTGRRDE